MRRKRKPQMSKESVSESTYLLEVSELKEMPVRILKPPGILVS